MIKKHGYMGFETIMKNECSKFPKCYKDADNLCWKTNSGYDNVVICEHVAFHFLLYNEGYKMYINPNMIFTR